jgi:uncharacterized protein (TIGR02757 family)
MISSQIVSMLEDAANRYESAVFVENDPISIPHQFSKKEDIEISGLFAAILAWGQRPVIIRNANDLIDRMDRAPFDFIINHEENDLKRFLNFKHRTFQYIDFQGIVKGLKWLYEEADGLEGLFSNKDLSIEERISSLRKTILDHGAQGRTAKHLPDPLNGSAAKRINMYLRWMVRSNKRGVDFGLWRDIEPGELFLPLDVHTGRTARELGLLARKQDDWRAVEEVTTELRKLDPVDPVKYDFALFGMGVASQ